MENRMFSMFDNEMLSQEDTEGENVPSRKKTIIPRLNCMGKINLSDDTFHPEGFVCSREFDCVLNGNHPAFSLYEDEEVRLFNRCFLSDEAFLCDTNILLTLTKATFENLQHAAKGNQVRSAGTPFKIMREQINQVMSYFRVCTHRFLTDFDTEMSELSLLYITLEDIFKHISLWMTPVADMPSIIFSGGSLNNDSAVSIFFHTYFDIRWSLVEMAFMASNLRKYSESARKHREKFAEILAQLLEGLCSDLMYLGLRRFPEISPSDWPGTTPFNCTCIREIWYMVLVMLKPIESSVFNYIMKQFQNLQTGSDPIFCQTFNETKRLKLPSKDPLALLWLFVHLSKLSGYNQTGTWDANFSRMEQNYEVVNKLVQLYFTSSVDVSVVNEDRTRGLMGCLYSLSQIWGSNLNLSIMLWDYFSKKLDDHFTPPSAFEPLPFSSSLSWYENLTGNVDPWKSLTVRHNSYFMFLRLLGYHFEQMNAKGQASLKARLYVKLQGKKVLELSPLGLYHIMSACLTITLTSDSPDMCSKILEMSEQNNKHGLVLFVAEMVLLLACVSRSRDCQEVAGSIARRLDVVSRGMSGFGDGGELYGRDEQRKYATAFIEGFQEVAFQSKNFSLGQIKLIDQPLKSYLKTCGSCDRSNLIDAITNLLRKLRNNSSNSDEVYGAVMTHIYPLMKDTFSLVEHVDFFAEMTIVALDTNRPEFQSLFTYFCLDDKVNPRLSLKYLAQLLEAKQFAVSLSLHLDNYQTILIQSWFRVSFLLPASTEYRQDLERLNVVIRRLPRMAELVVQSKMQINPRAEMIMEFLLMISTNHQNIQNYNDKAAVKEVYLQFIGSLDKSLAASSATSLWEPADQVQHIIRLGGQLFFHCGNIIYTKGKADCLLAQLNNTMLIPTVFSDLGKELPPIAASSLQQHLPWFIFGLFRLNPSREPFITRCLNGVFQSYMTRFPPNQSHPFTRCWTGLDSEPITNFLVSSVRSWFLQAICSNVLPQKVAKTSPYLQPVLQWLKYLATNKEWKVEIVRSTLLPILEVSLILDEVNCKRSVTDMLQVSVSGSLEPDLSELAEQALNDLVSRHLAFSTTRLFKLLEVISVLNAELVKRSLPKIRDQVCITEAKRGTGQDTILRQHLGTLEFSLGITKD